MKRLLVLLILWLPVYAHAALNVFACEPEWAALAKEIGGAQVSVRERVLAFQARTHLLADVDGGEVEDARRWQRKRRVRGRRGTPQPFDRW